VVRDRAVRDVLQGVELAPARAAPSGVFDDDDATRGHVEGTGARRSYSRLSAKVNPT
jgi:hypothetical protein